jgi:hypothetical protein
MFPPSWKGCVGLLNGCYKPVLKVSAVGNGYDDVNSSGSNTKSLSGMVTISINQIKRGCQALFRFCLRFLFWRKGAQEQETDEAFVVHFYCFPLTGSLRTFNVWVLTHSFG